MCGVLDLNRSGFYAWLRTPLSSRAWEDRRQAAKIKQFWLERGCFYGYRNITIDLKRGGERCGKNRVHRIMRYEGLAAVRGYRRHPEFKGGKQHSATANILNREFTVTKPDQVWVNDFTYIRPYEGWLHVTMVIDLFSRRVIGWTMKSSPKADLVIDALLMAVWGRRPVHKVLVHSDQGVQ
jgi:putative transposase